MGYNNNYAGMHMIWYGRKSSYDDLEYYDRLAAEDYKKKKEMARKVHNMENGKEVK